MDFQLFLPQMRFSVDELVGRATGAEAAGFGGMALMDHLAPPMAERHPMYDAMTTATWLAARTTRLTLGHLVLCDAMREPAVLAKEIVTLDHASGGRFELGIGSGSVPKELDTFGIFDGGVADRIDRLRETLEVLRALWTGEVIDYDGKYHQLREAQQMPTPLTSVPIVIGGSKPKMMRLVAEFADWWNLSLNNIDHIDALRESAGKARVSVQQMVAFVPDEARREEVTAIADKRFGFYGSGLVVGSSNELVDHFSRFADRGIERVYTWFADFASPETLEQFGAEVIAPLTT